MPSGPFWSCGRCWNRKSYTHRCTIACWTANSTLHKRDARVSAHARWETRAQSYMSKSTRRHSTRRLFCQECLCFNTMRAEECNIAIRGNIVLTGFGPGCKTDVHLRKDLSLHGQALFQTESGMRHVSPKQIAPGVTLSRISRLQPPSGLHAHQMLFYNCS